MSYEEAVSALRRQLGNISDSIAEKDKLIVQLNDAYRHEEKVSNMDYMYVCMGGWMYGCMYGLYLYVDRRVYM